MTFGFSDSLLGSISFSPNSIIVRSLEFRFPSLGLSDHGRQQIARKSQCSDGRIGGKHTAPELVVRRLLHSLGYRFRLHRRDLPGTPDIVFRRGERLSL